ncbi:MAG: cysteine--1-D-myo-inosityl 2-amino-2-deoxy-alpha-D-glucopyranoside ligase [Tetrasphaera sp.]
MQTWPTVVIPAIPGRGQSLSIHDTVAGAEPVPVTGHDGQVSIYVCGITPYDATHLGHAATYVTFDVIGRVLRDAGLRVRYVQNVTDVDEPLLQRAVRDGVDWRDLAEAETALFREDMTALAVLPPDELVGVVESIDLIAAAVQRLVTDGVTYALPVEDSAGEDIYLDLASVPGFGEVSSWSREQMDAVIVERGGDPNRPGKRDPLDPLLWRAERPGEPSWSAAGLAPGRPGWHIECTAIAADRLGLPIDIQGGGSDLVFPHHEMSAAQATAAGAEFAAAYVHQEMVGLHGHKMSKSKGNLVLVSRLRADGVSPMAIRLLLLAHRYDAPWDYTEDAMAAATTRLERWREGLSVNEGPSAEPVIAAIRETLANGLDTPHALRLVDAWVEQAVRGEPGDPAAPGLLARTIDALLGVRV